VVLEKRDANVHAHILLSCKNALDQLLTYLTVFQHMDNVPVAKREKPEDTAWRTQTWQLLAARIKEPFRTRSHAPVLDRVCPGGTAVVQMVRGTKSKIRVCRYMTKELSKVTLALASQSSYWATKADLSIRSLQDFHRDLGDQMPATCVRKDPKTGARSLNLDDPFPWKVGNRHIK
jgi:hypothetical protein